MRLGEALDQAVTRLGNEGVDSPRLDAELLLAHILEVNRAAILARPDQRLTPKELTRYRDLVTRRASREPLAYILGHREFYGLDFAVDPRALIPRPETELLIEHALSIARRTAQQPENPLQIADVGAGSGAIAVTLAVHLPQATLYALDASAGALAVVAENARRHHVAGRVRCLQSDLLAALPGPVDLITANLPYVTSEEWSDLAPEIRDHEPRAALDGGPDGLDLIRRLLATASPCLRPGGALLLEIGASQGAPVTALARKHFPQARVQLHQDYARLDRLVIISTRLSQEF
jgi:release factor glutamine methyltransferase